MYERAHLNHCAVGSWDGERTEDVALRDAVRKAISVGGTLEVAVDASASSAVHRDNGNGANTLEHY